MTRTAATPTPATALSANICSRLQASSREDSAAALCTLQLPCSRLQLNSSVASSAEEGRSSSASGRVRSSDSECSR